MAANARNIAPQHTGKCAPGRRALALAPGHIAKEDAFRTSEHRRTDPLHNHRGVTQLIRPREIVTHQDVTQHLHSAQREWPLETRHAQRTSIRTSMQSAPYSSKVLRQAAHRAIRRAQQQVL